MNIENKNLNKSTSSFKKHIVCRITISALLYPLLLTLLYNYSLDLKSSFLSTCFWILIVYGLLAFILSSIFGIYLWINKKERKLGQYLVFITTYFPPFLGHYDMYSRLLKERANKQNKTKVKVVLEEFIDLLPVIFIVILIFSLNYYLDWKVFYWLSLIIKLALGFVLSIFIFTVPIGGIEEELEAYGFNNGNQEFLFESLWGVSFIIILCFAVIFSHYIPIPSDLTLYQILKDFNEIF